MQKINKTFECVWLTKGKDIERMKIFKYFSFAPKQISSKTDHFIYSMVFCFFFFHRVYSIKTGFRVLCANGVLFNC